MTNEANFRGNPEGNYKTDFNLYPSDRLKVKQGASALDTETALKSEAKRNEDLKKGAKATNVHGDALVISGQQAEKKPETFIDKIVNFFSGLTKSNSAEPPAKENLTTAATNDVDKVGKEFKVNPDEVEHFMDIAPDYKEGTQGWTRNDIGFQDNTAGKEYPKDEAGITPEQAKVMHLVQSYEDEKRITEDTMSLDELNTNRNYKNFMNSVRNGAEVAPGLDLNGNGRFDKSEAEVVRNYDKSDGENVLSDKDIEAAYKKHTEEQQAKNNDPGLKSKKIALLSFFNASGDTTLQQKGLSMDKIDTYIEKAKDTPVKGSYTEKNKQATISFLQELKANPSLFKDISKASDDWGDRAANEDNYQSPEKVYISLVDLTR